MYEKEIEQLQKIIDDSSRIVFFGGAGVSTESGIPDFRSADGIYHQKYKYSPEQVVSHSFFMKYPEAFYDFYKDKMMALDAKPNPAWKHPQKLLYEVREILRCALCERIRWGAALRVRRAHKAGCGPV